MTASDAEAARGYEMRMAGRPRAKRLLSDSSSMMRRLTVVESTSDPTISICSVRTGAGSRDGSGLLQTASMPNCDGSEIRFSSTCSATISSTSEPVSRSR
jgi:hypothetical protein